MCLQKLLSYSIIQILIINTQLTNEIPGFVHKVHHIIQIHDYTIVDSKLLLTTSSHERDTWD